MWTEADFATETNVSRETLTAFSTWNDILKTWNKRINLVAPGEIDSFWHRHAFDSWQLTTYLPPTWNRIVDLGSGGGFPGIALGIFAKQRGQGEVHLVESIGKKATFLKTVSRNLSLPVQVHGERVEALDPLEADVITARAFAPLPRLLAYATPHLKPGGVLILPKGEKAEAEIAEARTDWIFDVESFKSLTSDSATILRLSGLERK